MHFVQSYFKNFSSKGVGFLVNSEKEIENGIIGCQDYSESYFITFARKKKKANKRTK